MAKITGRFLEERTSIEKVFKSKGVFKFRESFFYTHGRTTKNFQTEVEDGLKTLGLKYTIIEAHKYWNPWPKDSFFETVVEIHE